MIRQSIDALRQYVLHLVDVSLSSILSSTSLHAALFGFRLHRRVYTAIAVKCRYYIRSSCILKCSFNSLYPPLMFDVHVTSFSLTVVLDPHQRLAVFRKLEEMSKIYPVHMPVRRQPARQDYFQGTSYH